MRAFAAYSPAAFKEYTQKYTYFSGTLYPYIALAKCDEAIALRLLRMPFLAVDVADGRDGDTIAALARLAYTDVGQVDELLSHPLLEGGITEFDRAVVLLLVLEYERPEAAAMIQRLPWVREIIREAELSVNDTVISRKPLHYETFHWLLEMGDPAPESLLAFLELPWMQNQSVQIEHWLTDSVKTIDEVIRGMALFVSFVSKKSDLGMASILRMPFLQTLEPHDRDVLEILWETSNAGRSYTDGETPLRQLLSDPALEGGITDDNLGDLALADLRVRNPEYSSGLESLPWVRDGVSPSETSGLLALWKLEHLGKEVFQSVLRQQWVADGLTVYESSATHSFEQLVISTRNTKAIDGYAWHEEYVLTIPDKEFMRSVGPSKAALMRTSIRLLQNGGMEERTDLLSTILESDGTQKPERLITLPLAGEVALSVIWPAELHPDQAVRLGVSASLTMDILEGAVRANEELMGLPFPQKHAIVLIHDFPFGPPGSGFRDAFVSVDPTLSESVGLVTHEVAHAYWSGGGRWIDEGTAEFIVAAVSGNVPDYVSPSCAHFENLHDYMESPDRFQYDYCSYSLGAGMFVDLSNNLGEEAFRRGFTNLNLRIFGFVPSEGCMGIHRAVCHLKAAFADETAPGDASTSEEVINRRYYGTSAGASQ